METEFQVRQNKEKYREPDYKKKKIQNGADRGKNVIGFLRDPADSIQRSRR